MSSRDIREINDGKPAAGRPLRWTVGNCLAFLARRLGRSGGDPKPEPCPAPDSDPIEELGRRGEIRMRTQLRSAKLLDIRNRYFCDCAVVDRSVGGLGLRLPSDVSVASRFWLHDDLTQEILGVMVAWREGGSVGVRILNRDGFALLTPIRLIDRYDGIEE